MENDIQAVETLRWSWQKARIGLISGGLIVAVICGLPFGLLGGLTGGLLERLIGGLMMVLTFGLTFGLMGGLIAAIFNGLSREIIETKSFPNQGIRLSLISAISGGLRIGVIGMIGGLIFMLVDWQFDGLVYELGDWLIGGLRGWLAGAFLGALWYGGLDVIQHYTLRLILIFQGHTPRNYVRFLDYAVDHIFLQKVGGGYRFIHRMLLEHFAETYEEKA